MPWVRGPDDFSVSKKTPKEPRGVYEVKFKKKKRPSDRTKRAQLFKPLKCPGCHNRFRGVYDQSIHADKTGCLKVSTKEGQPA